MNKVFEKIIEKLEELHERYINQYGAVGGNPMAFSVKECMEIRTGVNPKPCRSVAVVRLEERTYFCI